MTSLRSRVLTLVSITSLFFFSSSLFAEKKTVTDFTSFIDGMVKDHQFDRETLNTLLQQAEVQPKILKAMSSPAEKRLEWHGYRNIFLKENRINGGVKFWQENKELLEAAEEKYHVPAEIITAIIGVETRFGGHTGRHRVLDSLVTLGFHFPKRATFFKSELKHFLLLSREEGIDPLEPKGSYAGAMGMPQFISSSYRAYAVDGDGDNKRNLWSSNADVIHSVANYFSRHGWKKDGPVTQQTTVQSEQFKKVLHPSLKLKHTVANLKEHQVSVPDAYPTDAPVKLLELQQKQEAEYWLAFENFYVITRYNHSHLYAMAVYQLSQEIKARYLQANG